MIAVCEGQLRAKATTSTRAPGSFRDLSKDTELLTVLESHELRIY